MTPPVWMPVQTPPTDSHMTLTRTRTLTVSIALAALASAGAQHPFRHHVDAVTMRYSRTQPVVHYSLRVDAGDLSAFSVEVRLRNVPDTFRLAMAKHPEYDDRFWRYVEGLAVEAGEGAGSVARLDSALWRVVTRGGTAVVRYRIRLPSPPESPRASWRPFLAPSGGLVGGPHAFMYVVGAELGPSHVVLELPEGWGIATGLEPTADPRTFFAPSVGALVESPMLVGVFRSWPFAIDGVPHRVVYWPLPNATPFDTVTFVRAIEAVARQAVTLFGRAPYREYTFLFQDGAYGGLEHPNSVTLGSPSASLAEDVHSSLGEMAHEFVHTWNLMRIRPAEYRGVDYRAQEPSSGLWFSEGLTMFYADLLPRRAGLPVSEPTRAAHLASLIGRYLSNPGNSRISPERSSRAAYGAPPGSLGDYDPSVHLQGELVGVMLDLVIRDATDNRRSMDDVMRFMLGRFSGERGFVGRDVERAVADVCGCEVRPFFDAHVRGATPIDVDRYLRLAGLAARVSWAPSLNRDGTPAVDLRLFGWQEPNDTSLRLLLTDPTSAWGRAGLHTGDRMIAMNGEPVRTVGEFRAVLRRLRIGDTVRVEVARPTGRWRTSVLVAGFDRPVVRVEERADATPRQRAVRERWMAGR